MFIFLRRASRLRIAVSIRLLRDPGERQAHTDAMHAFANEAYWRSLRCAHAQDQSSKPGFPRRKACDKAFDLFNLCR
jgi:hypothetical protein